MSCLLHFFLSLCNIEVIPYFFLNLNVFYAQNFFSNAVHCADATKVSVWTSSIRSRKSFKLITVLKCITSNFHGPIRSIGLKWFDYKLLLKLENYKFTKKNLNKLQQLNQFINNAYLDVIGRDINCEIWFVLITRNNFVYWVQHHKIVKMLEKTNWTRKIREYL